MFRCLQPPRCSWISHWAQSGGGSDEPNEIDRPIRRSVGLPTPVANRLGLYSWHRWMYPGHSFHRANLPQPAIGGAILNPRLQISLHRGTLLGPFNVRISLTQVSCWLGHEFRQYFEFIRTGLIFPQFYPICIYLSLVSVGPPYPFY